MGKRRNFTAKAKVEILKAHLVDKIAISDLCEKHGLQPTQFYQWQKTFFENGEAAFERPAPKTNPKRDKRLQFLTAKLQKKDEVLSELMEEHVALKKSLGEL